MKYRLPTAILLLFITTGVAQGATSGAPRSGAPTTKAYRWVDGQGVTHYGDSIPPENAQGNVAELNSRGVALKESPAQLAPAEQAAILKRDEDAAKVKQHDKFLLTTYTSAHDIEQLRDERVAQLEGQITASRGYIDSVGARLTSLRQRAGNFKPYSSSPTARHMPDALAAEIVQTLNEARSQADTLAARQQEVKEVRRTFQTDIDRYRELVSSQR
jgi:hypothetical protein